MAGCLTVGQDPCAVEAILEIMRNCERFPTLSSNLQNVAQTFGVVTEFMKSTMENSDAFLFEVLCTWMANRGKETILEELCNKLTSIEAKDIGDKLKEVFGRRVMDHFLSGDGLRTLGKALKMSHIFNVSPSLIAIPKKNDPMRLIPQFQVAHNTQSSYETGNAVDQSLTVLLNKKELKILEDYAFWKLGLDDLTLYFKTEAMLRDEDGALQVLQKLNVTNYGKSLVLWCAVARAVLKSRGFSSWRWDRTLETIFEFEDDDEDELDIEEIFNIHRTTTFPRFKNLLLVYFMDLLLGMEKEKGYQMRLKTDKRWIEKYAVSCLQCNATNLLNHLSQLPRILHHFVRDTVYFNDKELDARKKIILHIMSNIPAAVNSLNQDNLPPLLMTKIHVQIIQLLYNGGANMEAVNGEGKNIVHLGIEYLPTEQFQSLVHFLMGRNYGHLLQATDNQNRTPIVVNPRHLLSIQDIPTLHIFASAETNFNVGDKYGNNILKYAIKRDVSVELLEVLIQMGADWKWKTWDDETLLHLAVKKGNLAAVRYLVSLGCDVNAPTSMGQTPLDYAKFCRHANKEEVVEFLVEHGAN